ncbi:MAG: hypothetical protein ACRD0P_04840, partial [Stackebrandtia sp.]
LAATLGTVSSRARFDERQRLRWWYVDLAEIRAAFTEVSQRAVDDTGHLDIDLWLHHRRRIVADIEGVPVRDVMMDIDDELDRAGGGAYGAEGFDNRRLIRMAWTMERQIVRHHLANVYGRDNGESSIAALEQAANDFCGADLSTVEVDEDAWRFDARFEGVRWDEATRWPSDHAQRIRDTSTPIDGGRFLIGHANR